MVGFSEFVGYESNTPAKLLAIRRCLEVAWKRGIRKLGCESDSIRMISDSDVSRLSVGLLYSYI